VLPHWTDAVNGRYAERIGKPVALPPDGVHSKFYPQRGPYSVSDPETVNSQMGELQRAGVGTVVLSWWGRPGASTGDSQGVVTDSRIGGVLDAAFAAGLRVAWHLEPYHGRSAESVLADVSFLWSRYGAHPALLRWPLPARPGVAGPVYYVYDSYHIPASDWRAVFTPDDRGSGEVGHESWSVRGTELDGVFIGLWLDRHHGQDLLDGGFDGAYTYFASDGFSWGASTRNWATIRNWATQHDKLFVASVGPGYNDEGIRPWNAANTKSREGGAYYRRFWQRAMDVDSEPTRTVHPEYDSATAESASLGSGRRSADAVSITSYNEWGEGTQIEPAVPRETYEDYDDAGGAGAYMELTAELAAKFRSGQRRAQGSAHGGQEHAELR
jgi:glycoprotein endo-alpha-1,2-mannosidase